MSNENPTTAPVGLDPETQAKLHESFWKSQTEQIENINMRDLKLQDLPLARIKKIMKLDENVKMISAEVPIIFAKAAELFISEITMRGWWCTEENKRRTLQKSDIALAASRYDQFDFLIDIVPREEIKPSPKKPTLPLALPSKPTSQPQQPQFQYYFQMPLLSNEPLVQTNPPPLIYSNHVDSNHVVRQQTQQQHHQILTTPSTANNQPAPVNLTAAPSGSQGHSYPLLLVAPSVAAGIVNSDSGTVSTKSPGVLEPASAAAHTVIVTPHVKAARKQVHNSSTTSPATGGRGRSAGDMLPHDHHTHVTSSAPWGSGVGGGGKSVIQPAPIQLTQQQLEALLGMRIHNMAPPGAAKPNGPPSNYGLTDRADKPDENGGGSLNKS